MQNLGMKVSTSLDNNNTEVPKTIYTISEKNARKVFLPSDNVF